MRSCSRRARTSISTRLPLTLETTSDSATASPADSAFSETPFCSSEAVTTTRPLRFLIETVAFSVALRSRSRPCAVTVAAAPQSVNASRSADRSFRLKNKKRMGNCAADCSSNIEDNLACAERRWSSAGMKEETQRQGEKDRRQKAQGSRQPKRKLCVLSAFCFLPSAFSLYHRVTPYLFLIL